MNIIKINKDENTMINIEKVTEKLTLEDFSDIKDFDMFSDFIQKEILNKILFSVVGDSGDIKIDRRYDFVFEKNIIEICSPFLEENEKFFNEKIELFLIENNIENICLEVDEDSEAYDYINQTIEKTQILNLKIVPTYTSFERFSSKMKKEFENYKDLFKVKCEISEVIEKFYERNGLSFDFQIGGNTIYCIQGDYDNLIFYYYGEYGDCGAAYVYLENNSINATVDMH